MPFRIIDGYWQLGSCSLQKGDPSLDALHAYELWLLQELKLVRDMIDMAPKPKAAKAKE